MSTHNKGFDGELAKNYLNYYQIHTLSVALIMLTIHKACLPMNGIFLFFARLRHTVTALTYFLFGIILIIVLLSN